MNGHLLLKQPAAGQSTPLLSIIIPTRERCEFLASSVRSALACADPRIEVVVSDNASTDATRSVVDHFHDARLIYANPGSRIAMHDNFEFALAQSRGQYLMFIGDDDAVLPNGIRRLLELLQKEQPDVVNWRFPAYVWPGAANGARGLLTIKPQHLVPGFTTLNAREMLTSLANGNRESYRFGGAKIYHGCVARPVVERVISRVGRYFLVPWPDVGAAIANLFVVKEILELGQPCTLPGESRASNGWSQRFEQNTATFSSTPHAKFVGENPPQAAVDARVRPISALTYLSLAETVRRIGEPGLKVNPDTWLPMIESELASLTEPLRTEQADVIDANLRTAGLPLLDRTWPQKQKYKRAVVRPPVDGNRFLPNRLCIVSRPGFCSDAYEASLVADEILGRCAEVSPTALLAKTSRWMRALTQARRISQHGLSHAGAGAQ